MFGLSDRLSKAMVDWDVAHSVCVVFFLSLVALIVILSSYFKVCFFLFGFCLYFIKCVYGFCLACICLWWSLGVAAALPGTIYSGVKLSYDSGNQNDFPQISSERFDYAMRIAIFFNIIFS